MTRNQRDERTRAPRLRRFTALRDHTIAAVDGDIGSVVDVYFDDRSWTVRYLVVDTGTWLSGRQVLLSPVSLRGVEPAGSRVRTELTRQQVQDSPSIDTDKPVSRQHETDLQVHYGYAPYWVGSYRWGMDPYPFPTAEVLPAGGAPVMEGRVAEELAAREREYRDEHLHNAREVTGYAIRATDGDLGHVEDFFIDEEDWAIRYLLVDPRSWWPGPHVIIGTDWIRNVNWDDHVVAVDVTRDAVRGAPRYEPSSQLGRDEEMRLYAHHRRPGYWDRSPEAWRHYPPAA
jgi:hypothetical protein